MATKDFSSTGICKPAVGLDKFYVMHNYIDFTVTANQLANGETGAIFDIPANTMVLYVLARVATADAQIADTDLGIEGATTDGFLDAMNITTTGWKTDVDEAYSIAAAAPFVSTSNSVVLFTNSGGATLNEAKLHFYAICVDLTDASAITNA
jgi:hypothetical protein